MVTRPTGKSVASDRVRGYRLQRERRVFRHLAARDRAERRLGLRQRGVGLHVAGDHQDGVVRRVPGFVEAPDQGGIGLLNHGRVPRASC